jgi:D-alanine-D-alanine ligase
MKFREQKIVVLMGGSSREREVSLNTGQAMYKALKGLGYEVVSVDFQVGNLDSLVGEKPGAVVLALHGGYGEGGTVQGLLNAAAIPYTGSGVAASAIAMDKVISKGLFSSARLHTPAYMVISKADAIPEYDEITAHLGCDRMVVKPATEGSSVGINMVHSQDLFSSAVEEALQEGPTVLVEQFIEGHELSVGVFDGEVMGTVEIVPESGFYSYDAKYVSGTTRYLIPPSISSDRVEAAENLALKAYEQVGCRGVARVDLMCDGSPWILEINTLPGMTENSLVPKLAAARGEQFERLVERMLNSATVDKE